MARPQRNNVDYFPLYVDNGRKMFFIESKYGNDGYATWLKLLSELARANYHYLNLKDETQLMYIHALCKVDNVTLENIINDLVKLGEFNGDLWEEKILYSEKFIESISDAYNKRTNNPPSLSSLVQTLKGLGVLKHGFKESKGVVKPQSIVKNSIEEIRKWYRSEWELGKTIFDEETDDYKKQVFGRQYKSYGEFAKFLFDEELEPLLKMSKQIRFKDYQKLYSKAESKHQDLKQLALALYNDFDKYGKRKKSLYYTLNNWLNMRK